jgi:hypothetical protein
MSIQIVVDGALIWLKSGGLRERHRTLISGRQAGRPKRSSGPIRQRRQWKVSGPIGFMQLQLHAVCRVVGWFDGQEEHARKTFVSEAILAEESGIPAGIIPYVLNRGPRR